VPAADRAGTAAGRNPLDLRPMDPRDDLDSLAGGVDCAACGEFVPTDRIRILAQRDDIVFVEVTCPACRSDSLGIVIAEDDENDENDDAELAAVGPGRTWGEFGSADVERFRESLPIDAADVDLVRRLLATGDLGALIGGSPPPDASSGPQR
jgi:hypothetical protein